MPYYVVRIDEYRSGKRHIEVRGGPYESRAQADGNLPAVTVQGMSTFAVWTKGELDHARDIGTSVHDTLTGRW